MLEVVEGSENLEICVICDNKKIEMVDEEKLLVIYNELKTEKEAAELER